MDWNVTEIFNELKDEKKRILFQSFFNKNGEPLPFFRSIIERDSKLDKSLSSIFPYQVPCTISKDKVVDFIDAEDGWMIFISKVYFMNENDFIRFQTFLRLFS